MLVDDFFAQPIYDWLLKLANFFHFCNKASDRTAAIKIQQLSEIGDPLGNAAINKVEPAAVSINITPRAALAIPLRFSKADIAVATKVAKGKQSKICIKNIGAKTLHQVNMPQMLMTLKMKLTLQMPIAPVITSF